MGLAGGLLLWVAFPPLDWWPLAWVAPIFWVWLVRMRKLPGRRPYRALYLAGFIHWLLLIQWVRLPHWTAYFGWLALTCYLAFYLPLFVGLARVAAGRLRMPILFAAPVVWTGLELARGHLLTGFSIALLGHTQVKWHALIQIADLAGAYAVSFVVIFAAACLARMLPVDGRPAAWWPFVPLVVTLAATLAYGQYRTGQTTGPEPPRATVRVALIQGSIDTVFDDTRLASETFKQYRELSLEAIRRDRNLDLIVWPESMFTAELPLITHDAEFQVPADGDLPPVVYRKRVREFARLFHDRALAASRELRVPMLVGAEAVHYGSSFSPQRYNTAILIEPSGTISGPEHRYEKMHRVMFGEYVPLGEVFPWLYRLTPMYAGLTPGSRPQVFDVAGLKMAPSICFENTVPHLIRRQVEQLRRGGSEPDVLMTVTNDGWFWGSSLLDLHLTCGVFRAVENRKPVLVAGNTGFSAWIDGNGRIVEKGPRRRTGIVWAHVRPDGRTSGYRRLGDLPAGVCLAVCLAATVAGVLGRLRTARTEPRPSGP